MGVTRGPVKYSSDDVNIDRTRLYANGLQSEHVVAHISPKLGREGNLLNKFYKDGKNFQMGWISVPTRTGRGSSLADSFVQFYSPNNLSLMVSRKPDLTPRLKAKVEESSNVSIPELNI